MTIPHEDALAFFPPSVTAGNLTLGPLTLAGVVRLAELGVDLGRRVPKDKLFQAAHVLANGAVTRGRVTLPSAVSGAVGSSVPLDRFLRKARVGLKELSTAVEKVLNDAFSTYVKAIVKHDGPIRTTPHGLGWPLEYAEYLCGEYGWSWETAINTPVVTAFALSAAHHQRYGGQNGIDYLEKAYAKTLK